ncbi:DNA polymerase III subunit delta [Gorillibacterium massiliense]|uniref:DNA polymerase III subunit delta n=1 Tax=Gorillibacterium massiliense TaxID=1280390 RepID=UPI0004B54A62|nr:DNA polymerase III subunit delta [Gorillibacterium massiliense]
MGNEMPVIVCYGPETFLIREYIDGLIKKKIDPEHMELAVSRYDLAETPLEVVLDDAETAPFLVPVKVVLAKNAAFLTGAKESGKVEHKTERLAEYLASPADDSVVIFTVDAEKLDERKKIVKTLKEKKALKAFPSLPPEEQSRWVSRRADARKVTMDPKAIEAFVLLTGGQLQTMATELDKLALYAGEGGKITRETVEALVVRSTEQNVFLLIEDIVQRRMEKAFALLYELLKMKEEPIKLVALMARQFRLILQVKELLAEGYSQQQIASQLGSHPYPVKLAAEQGRRYAADKLAEILSGLADLDYQMKSGKIDKVLGMEMLMLRIAAA